jgi:hypothetical protein
MLSNIDTPTLQRARAQIETLRRALTGPQLAEIDAALPGLEEATRCLETVEREIREGCSVRDDVHRELKLLKKDLRISARLIGQGLAFCQGWANIIAGGSSYTQAGETAPLDRWAGSVSLRG